MTRTLNNFAMKHIADDWGFYVDLESIKTFPNNEDKIRQKYNVKRYSIYDAYNKHCNNICEEYNYHIQNNKNDDDYSIDVDLSIDNIRNTLEENNASNVTSFIVRASSTTIITAFLTYVVFFIL